MKKSTAFLLFFLFLASKLTAQIPPNIKKLFPQGTVMHLDIPYASDTLVKHTLDLYLPAKQEKKVPLVIWIHGGGWRQGNKYGDTVGITPNLISPCSPSNSLITRL